MNSPLVSIVIPCYNHAEFVQDSIQSVIDQSYANIELIIIDDGSPDYSVEKINQMLDACQQRFVRFEFRTRPNKGLSVTLNEALEWCQGEFFSALASDDQMFNDKSAIQVDLLTAHQEYVAVFGAVQLIDNNGIVIGEIRQQDKVFEFNDLMYTDRFLPAPTQMIRLNELRRAGGFVNGMIIEDWYIYLKLMEEGGKILYTDQLFCCYRSHGGNTFANPYKMALGRLQVLNEFQKQELFKKSYIKVCWDNALETFMIDFKLSSQILCLRLLLKVKQIVKKVFSKRS